MSSARKRASAVTLGSAETLSTVVALPETPLPARPTLERNAPVGDTAAALDLALLAVIAGRRPGVLVAFLSVLLGGFLGGISNSSLLPV